MKNNPPFSRFGYSPYLLGVLLLCTIVKICFHLNPDNFLADDAYFYLVIGEKMASLKGSTFHEVTPTNGYHPLWQWICALGALLVNSRPTLHLHMMGLIQTGLVLGILYLYKQIADKLELKLLFPGCFVFLFFLFFLPATNLFEIHLSIYLQILLIHNLLSLEDTDRSSSLIRISLLFALVFLARLDNIFVVGSLGGWAILTILKNSPNKIRQLSLLLGPALLITVSYLVYNRFAFGTFVPISGLIKSHFPTFTLSLGSWGFFMKLVIIPSLLIVFLSFITVIKRGPSLIACVFLGTILHLVYTVGFTYDFSSPWYFGSLYLSVALAITYALEWISKILLSWKSPFLMIARCLTLVPLIAMTALSVVKVNHNFYFGLWLDGKVPLSNMRGVHPGKRVASLIRDHVKPHEAVFVFDSPGIIAFYSGRKIFPMDGLVNDISYDVESRKVGIHSYLKQHHISHVLLPQGDDQKIRSYSHIYLEQESPKSSMISITSPLSRKKVGSLEIKHSNLLWTSPNPIRGSETNYPFVGLWKLS